MRLQTTPSESDGWFENQHCSMADGSGVGILRISFASKQTYCETPPEQRSSSGGDLFWKHSLDGSVEAYESGNTLFANQIIAYCTTTA